MKLKVKECLNKYFIKCFKDNFVMIIDNYLFKKDF